MDRGASGATVQRVSEEWKQLSYCTRAKSNKDLLFSIRNSVQYSVRTHWGKESKKTVNICIRKTDSLFGTPKTNTNIN